MGTLCRFLAPGGLGSSDLSIWLYLPGLCLHLHMVPSRIRGTILMTTCQLDHLRRACFQIRIHPRWYWGLEFQHILWGTHSAHKKLCSQPYAACLHAAKGLIQVCKSENTVVRWVGMWMVSPPTLNLHRQLISVLSGTMFCFEFSVLLLRSSKN